VLFVRVYLVRLCYLCAIQFCFVLEFFSTFITFEFFSAKYIEFHIFYFNIIMKENARPEGREPNSISKMKPHERLFYVVLNQLKISKSKRFGPALLT
jgi:hypothetical protein